MSHPSDDTPTYRCRACEFRGTRDELDSHLDAHPRCIVCGRPLTDTERQTCSERVVVNRRGDTETRTPCVDRVRDDLAGVAVAYAHLERVVWQSAYRTGRLPGGDALVMVADGSLQGGGPDEWLRDPTPVIAVLESCERDWRHTFRHGPADDLATVARCLVYLRTWHTLAARTHPAFDSYATEIANLRSRLEHVVGMADDPIRAPAACFDCGGQLIRVYGETGLTDDWSCRQCKRDYDQPSYFLALRASRENVEGWVPVVVAAAAIPVPESTLWRWAARGWVDSRREAGRMLVEWSEVHARVMLRDARRTA